MMFIRKYFILAAAFVPFFTAELFAQYGQNMTVGNIAVEISGPQYVSKDAVLSHIKLRSGQPFDQHSLDLSIKSLYDTDLYDAVEVKRNLNSFGNLDLVLNVRPKYRISQIVLRGNKSYSNSRIIEQITSEAGGVLDDRRISRDSDKIVEFYRKKGYAFAKANAEIRRNDEAGIGVVVFNIDEGEDIKIQNIRFEGNAHISGGELEDQMKTSTWIWLISYLTDAGRFNNDDFQNDINLLKQHYRNNGFLDVKIDDSKVRFEFPDASNPGDMDIVIAVDEGKQYKAGKITFKNNKLFDSKTLNEGLDIQPGDVFSPALVDSSVDWVKNFYGQFGYLDTNVRALRRPNLEKGEIDLIIEIYEGEKFYLESINIQGNTKTKSEVILRELALAPGDVFYLDLMKDSEMRLQSTRFFDEVSLEPEATNIPGRRDLRIIVKEGHTGNVVFGAGFSTVESFVVTAELSQSNFDILNYKNMFQGAGQKFRLRASLGFDANQVSLSFENPYVFNRNLAYGFELYRTDTGYYSDDYSELRTGMTHYIRKYLFELVEARLGYTIENVKIYDLSRDAPQVIKKEEGNRSISQISLSFLREARDNLMMPTSGTRFEFLQQVAGGPLQGDTNLYRVEARAGWWVPMSKYFGNLPIFKYGNQVFSIVGRTGSVTGYDGKEVPFFERYFLGGAYNMRGFKYRRVGPIEQPSDEPEGGNTFAYFSLEYSYQIIEPLRIAVFYDWGFVNSSSWDWNASDYNDDFGIGFRIMIMGAPMRIDLGMPLTTGKYNDEGLQFNFSFGTVF